VGNVTFSQNWPHGALCTFLIKCEMRTSQNCCIDSNQILLNDRDPQEHVCMVCALGAKSAIYIFLFENCNSYSAINGCKIILAEFLTSQSSHGMSHRY